MPDSLSGARRVDINFLWRLSERLNERAVDISTTFGSLRCADGHIEIGLVSFGEEKAPRCRVLMSNMRVPFKQTWIRTDVSNGITNISDGHRRSRVDLQEDLPTSSPGLVGKSLRCSESDALMRSFHGFQIPTYTSSAL
jgi:hypothetical protein